MPTLTAPKTKRNCNGEIEREVFCKSVGIDGTFYGRTVIMHSMLESSAFITLQRWNGEGKRHGYPKYEYSFV